ncbi:bis-aminopropyl spermidine synthase family protein [Agrobacterium tumefaciens]|uniref:bis-aminopropyl spermidine synthase family protein n=1 Tax=Agrobacterium tumefaciens TaxID=358 RepID=UPI0015720361|nr:bis-aminopropyl spermidine synthase family protein [Agrobacterium tumefaciens]
MTRKYEKVAAGEVTTAVSRVLGQFGPQTLDALMTLVPTDDKMLFSVISDGIAAGRIERAGNRISLAGQDRSASVVRSECPCCGGRLAVGIDNVAPVKARYLEACAGAPVLTYLLNQRPVTRETSWHRALYMAMRGDLDGKKIVILGDDDLCSLAISLLATNSEVLVLEADERLVGFLGDEADKLKLTNFSVMEYDCREDIAPHLQGTFDVALCDPSSSLFEIFLSRCVTLLGEGGGRTIYTFAGPTYLQPNLDFQRLVTAMGLIVGEMIPAFNRYALVESEFVEGQRDLLNEVGGAERISFVESLVRLETCATTVAAIKGRHSASAENLYGERAFRRLQNLASDPASLVEPRETWHRLMEKFGPSDRLNT